MEELSKELAYLSYKVDGLTDLAERVEDIEKEVLKIQDFLDDRDKGLHKHMREMRLKIEQQERQIKDLEYYLARK